MSDTNLTLQEWQQSARTTELLLAGSNMIALEYAGRIDRLTAALEKIIEATSDQLAADIARAALHGTEKT